MNIFKLSACLFLILIPSLSFAIADKETEGNCSPIITGKINAPVTIECKNSTIPLAALATLEAYLQENYRSQKNLNDLLAIYQKEIKEWEKRYHSLQESIQQDLKLNPANNALKRAEQATTTGNFELAAKILEQVAQAQDQKIEKEMEKAASYHYKTAKAYQLSFKPWKALPHLKKAYNFRPDNVDYAFDYAFLAQEQNQRQEAEQAYKQCLHLIPNNASLNVRAVILNNLANLISDDTQRRQEAEQLHQEALSIRRTLATTNPQVYLPDVARLLNNLAIIIQYDTQRRQEAEQLYQEALSIHRTLAKTNPQFYSSDVAIPLNNLALLISDDTQRRQEAEQLYQEALTIVRTLVITNPQVHLPDVATLLNNLAVLVSDDTQRRQEAEHLYQEALSIRRTLAQTNPQVYLPYVATSLNNLATLIQYNTQRRQEAEQLYQEALSIHRTLVTTNSQVYLSDVAHMLGSFGVGHVQWKMPKKAKHLLRESIQYLDIFGDKQVVKDTEDVYQYSIKIIGLIQKETITTWR